MRYLNCLGVDSLNVGLSHGCYSHLIGKIDLLLAVHLLFDLALLGQLLQRLDHRLTESGTIRGIFGPGQGRDFTVTGKTPKSREGRTPA